MSNIVINGTTVTGDLVHDEQIGVQHDGSDDDVALADLSSGLTSFLATLTVSPATGFPGYAKTGISGYDAAATDLSLTDANGDLYAGLLTTKTSGGEAITLTSAAGGNAIIGTTAGGSVAFVIYLDETKDGSTGLVTGAQLNFVQYLPLDHADPDKVDAQDTIDFNDLVYLTASGTRTVTDTFNDNATANSGNMVFAVVKPDFSVPDVNGIVERAIVATAGNNTSAFIDVNVSGAGVAAGDNQTDDTNGPTEVNEFIRVDFVTNADYTYGASQDDSFNAALSFDTHFDVDQTGFTLTRVTSGTKTDLLIKGWNVADAAEATDGASFDDVVNQHSVATLEDLAIYNATGTKVAEYVDGVQTVAPPAGVVIAYDGTTFRISGMEQNWRVEFSSASNSPMDRFTVQNVGQYTTNGTTYEADFTIGRIKYTSSTVSTTPFETTTEIGANIVVEDDGPTISADLTGADTAQVDETNLGTSDTASLGGVFSTQSFGADGAGTLAFKLGVSVDGVDSGLTDTETGQTIRLHYVSDTLIEGRIDDGTVAVKFTMDDTTSGDVKLTQLRAVVHDSTSDNNDSKGLASAGVLTLTGTITDDEGDHDSTSVGIGALFTILDDGPSITADGTVGALHVDESFIPVIGSGDTGGDYDRYTDSASFAGLFSATYGADQAGSIKDFALGIGQGITDSGLDDSLTGLDVLVKLVGTKVVGYIDDNGTEKTVFEVEVDSSGNVTLTQMRAVLEGATGTSPDNSNSTSMAAGVITLSAKAYDKEGDSSSAATANIGNLLVFHDDGPTVGARQAWEVDFKADGATGDLTGNIGGVNGADGATASLISFTNHADFNENQVGNTVTYSKGGEDWFKFTANADGTFEFKVLKDGAPTTETFNFGSVKPGAPVETATVKTQFGHALGVFDGVIFNGSGANNYTQSLTKNVDDINPDKLGFGIMGNNPNQASQINNNEGFLVKLEEATDVFRFDIQGIGNNAIGVHVEFTAWNDTNGNGKVDGMETVILTDTKPLKLNSGNSLTEFKIGDANTPDFTNVNVRFYFDSSDLQNGALSGNALRQAIDNAGVRVLNFGAKQVDTIPEYDLQFGIKRTDAEGDNATTYVGVHVDPDHTPATPTTIPDANFPWLIV